MTDETPTSEYEKDRKAAYDKVLGAVQKHIEALPLPVMQSVMQISPADARDAAEREAWKLFEAGVRHLKDGGFRGSAGSFADAVSKGSLRSSSMAETLAVKAPKYEEHYIDAEFDTGAAEAFWRSLRLMEALADDAPRSLQFIRQKLAFNKPLSAADTAVTDPELKGVFDAAQKTAAGPTADDPFITALRRQSVLSFNLLADLYAPATEALKKEIVALVVAPPPKPALKNQSFDL